jgi:ABC-2 type transport system ATP-binding protein
MTAPAIETQNLTKEYPHGFLHLKRKTSLENLTMQVEDGEVFGFLGPNGAGKSTTIKLLMGIIFPTAGSARILGKPVSDVSMHRDIGYLPEQPYFYDYLTAAEVLDYFARFHDFSAAECRKCCRGLAWRLREKFSCGNFRKECCSVLGWRRRFCTIPSW